MVENSKGEYVSTYQINSQRKDPRTLEAPAKRWRVQKKVERKEVEKEEEKEENSEAQKKSLVDKAQSKNGELPFVGKKRRTCERKKQEEKQESQEQFLGRSGRWLFLLLILVQNWFCVDAAAGRLEPKGEAEVLEIIVVSDAVEGTFANLDGGSIQKEQKEKHQRKWKRTKRS